MSKNEKFRDRLASIQKNREDFEKQKKELENEMNIGRQNMGKIQKGLKNNGILDDAIVIEPVAVPSSEKSLQNTNLSTTTKKYTGGSSSKSNALFLILYPLLLFLTFSFFSFSLLFL